MESPGAVLHSEVPRVSVILTVYKRIDYLLEALDSALAQSYPSFEIIVVDDSGRAAAQSVVANRENRWRLRYLPNPETLGVALKLGAGRGTSAGRIHFHSQRRRCLGDRLFE